MKIFEYLNPASQQPPSQPTPATPALKMGVEALEGEGLLLMLGQHQQWGAPLPLPYCPQPHPIPLLEQDRWPHH